MTATRRLAAILAADIAGRWVRLNEKVYKETNPAYAFNYQFVDEEYKKLYSSELIISKLSVLFATLAILISCLGLLGLVMFAAEQRIREGGQVADGTNPNPFQAQH